MSDLVKVTSDGAVRHITIGNGLDNRLDMPAITALTSALIVPANSPERIVVIEGSGANFCGGRAAGKGLAAGIGSLEIGDTVARPILALYAAVRACQLPVAAMVRGRAVGLGCALAGICDITWAEEGSIFSLPELNSDLPPTLALTALTPRISAKAAGELVFTRREIDCEEALRIGLCNRVISAGKLADEKAALASRMTANSRRSLATVKAHLAATAYGTQGLMSDIAAELIASSLAETSRAEGSA